MRLYGLLAHPVSHSLSPSLYQAWFEEYGMKDAQFGLFDVMPEELGDFMQRVRKNAGGNVGAEVDEKKISGLAVSIPHKETVMQYLDEVDEVAREIGAVNTLHVADRRSAVLLKGWNTDWIGVREAFKEANVSVQGKRVLILGAGGAARAVIYALMHEGAQVVITNRTFDRAEDLASIFRCPLIHWEDRESVEAEIVINTTSVGLENPDESPVSAGFWKNAQQPDGRHDGRSHYCVAFDLVYRPNHRPKMTKFLSDALEAGCKIITGDRMLFHQGKAQFEILSGLALK